MTLAYPTCPHCEFILSINNKNIITNEKKTNSKNIARCRDDGGGSEQCVGANYHGDV